MSPVTVTALGPDYESCILHSETIGHKNCHIVICETQGKGKGILKTKSEVCKSEVSFSNLQKN